LAAREASENRYRTLVDVFNVLGEQTTFATDESDMYLAAAAALSRLVPSTEVDILVVDPAGDRLSVTLTWADPAAGPGGTGLG
jgi:hypothetical protein